MAWIARQCVCVTRRSVCINASVENMIWDAWAPVDVRALTPCPMGFCRTERLLLHALKLANL